MTPAPASRPWITRLIFDWAKKTPDRTAVIYNGKAWSYRSFAKAIAVARGYFARRGYEGPGCAVLATPNIMNFWVLSLALRSLGLTTVSADPTMIRGLGLANVRCVITTPDRVAGLDGLCNELGLSLLSVSLAGESALGLEATQEPHQLGGHILLTSGTTGTFKKVLMTPEIDANIFRLYVELFGMNQHTLLNVFSFGTGTGPGYKWVASPWSVGGATLIEQGGELYRALLHPGITHAVLTPRMLANILAAPADAFPRNDAMQLGVGGAAMTQTQVGQAKARITPHLFHYIGCTEAGIFAFTSLDTPEDQRWHQLVPSRMIEIVDASDRAVPTGEVGQVRINTAGGPTGYFNDETTTRAFFRDGFFYTGDLAVMRSDGRIALQGRVTDVINVQGAKISPAPIEERLGELLGVNGVCLFSMQNDSGEEEIHVVVETPKTIDSDRLTSALNQALRGFHRARVHYVATLPRNDMGKVLRQEVRAQVIPNQRPLTRMHGN